MSTLQSNATEFNPNKLELVEVARYQRTIDAPLERVWENVLDWEHLPHLHASSFNYIELDDGGEWGWRTWSDAEHAGHLELCVASRGSYVARSYVGSVQVSEIWTSLEPRAQNTDIDVTFYFPNVEQGASAGLGDTILALYSQLWDEDEAMMRERHRRLAERRDASQSITLGDRDALVRRLRDGDTIRFQLRRREYQLRYHNGELLAHPTICPHLLGPLGAGDLSNGRLTCPWHGYQFDLATGACLSPAHATCSLPANATLTQNVNEIIATTG